MIIFSGKVHFGFALIVWMLIQVQIDNVLLNPIPFLIGSVFPDSDIKYSMIGKFLPLWLFFKHRGFTHSLVALVIFSGIVGVFFGWRNCSLFACGYLLHLAMDSSTPMGVKWLIGHKKRAA